MATAQQSEPAAYPWKAGVASVKITPEKPMWMSGYASRTQPSEGVALDLYAKALALEDAEGRRLVMLTMDLIGIPQGLRRQVEEECAQKYKLPAEGLLLNASHTHCGPEFHVGATMYLEVMDHQSPDAEEYGAKLERQLVDLAGEALGKLAPAHLHYTHSRCGFAMNRRFPTLRGYNNSPYPEGPVDHDVPVLEVTGADGKQLLAVMFGYACHNTTLSFQQFCGDYAGFAKEELKNAQSGVGVFGGNG
jgi:neutral ceramidase